MKPEYELLLLEDLSARLPYGVKVTIEITKGKYTPIYDLRDIANDTTSIVRQRVMVWHYGVYGSLISYPLVECRAYLRPMSSMTKEERHEVQEILGPGIEINDGFIDVLDCDIHSFTFLELKAVFAWLNKKMFDYMGLIPKGLALKAPEGMYQ